MKQAQYSPMSVAEMAVSLFAMNQGYMDDLEVGKLLAFEAELHKTMKTKHGAFMDKINTSGDLDKEGEAQLTAAVTAFKKDF